MTDSAPARTTVPGPAELLAALVADAGGTVDGARPGSEAHAPDTTPLSDDRATAVRAAWTGARLHAGLEGLLAAPDPDLALLVGDWCFAHSLQSLAHTGDLIAIGRLAAAIGECATALTPGQAGTAATGARLAEIWAVTCADLVTL